MKAVKDLERKIRQKEEEVKRLNEELMRAKAYLDAYCETLRLIKKTSNSQEGDTIRPGSMVHQALLALRNFQKPMHVSELLQYMGKESTKNNRVSLSGSLGTYVRDRTVFTRPAPNTFGLIEFDSQGEDEIPDNFGS